MGIPRHIVWGTDDELDAVEMALRMQGLWPEKGPPLRRAWIVVKGERVRVFARICMYDHTHTWWQKVRPITHKCGARYISGYRGEVIDGFVGWKVPHS